MTVRNAVSYLGKHGQIQIKGDCFSVAIGDKQVFVTAADPSDPTCSISTIRVVSDGGFVAGITFDHLTVALKYAARTANARERGLLQ
jgi:hypothetical protein